jgi:cation diffusion facilitator CzcD-associated flavoprotein CzcO
VIRAAIVGGGLAGFTAYATLRHAGLQPAEIVVFADETDPAAGFRRRTAAIRQREMRSESDGHCFPRSFPGLAVREAVRRRVPGPLLRTVTNRYRPSLAEFLAHVDQLCESCGWDLSVRTRRVARVRAVARGFELDGEGPFAHVLLAPGYPGLAVPGELACDPRAVHAYEPHEYARSVAVVGAGMAAATEWINALDQGAEVVSVRRREPARRPLNVERPLFSKRGLARYHAAPADERAVLLRAFSEPSFPPGRQWDEPLDRATREGRFRVETAVNGAEQIICATGFLKGFRHDTLLADLVDEHGLETVDRWIVLDADSTVPALSGNGRTLALAGAQAQWAYPAADTLMGMKYAARRFARRVACPTR